MNRRTINKQKLQLIFTCETEYEMYRREYYVLWISEGNKIIDTFEIITHLPFIEREIKVKVGKGDKYGNNYAGERIREPMLF